MCECVRVCVYEFESNVGVAVGIVHYGGHLIHAPQSGQLTITWRSSVNYLL